MVERLARLLDSLPHLHDVERGVYLRAGRRRFAPPYRVNPDEVGISTGAKLRGGAPVYEKPPGKKPLQVSAANVGVTAPPGPYRRRSRKPNAPTWLRTRRISGWKMTTVDTAM